MYTCRCICRIHIIDVHVMCHSPPDDDVYFHTSLYLSCQCSIDFNITTILMKLFDGPV